MQRALQLPIRFSLILLFVFGLLTGSAATARAASGVIGFIPLVDEEVEGQPVALTARHAFEQLLPALQQAQKEGRINSFRPELMAGLLLVEFAPGDLSAASQTDGAASFEGLPIYADAHQALGSIQRPQKSPDATPASYDPQFSIGWKSSCFSVSGLNPNDHVRAALKDASGKVIATYEGDPDSNGEIWEDCFNDYNFYIALLPGYTVVFKVYNNLFVLVDTFTQKAPATLGITAIDKASSVVSGVGPAGKPINISWYQQKLDAAHGSISFSVGKTINSKGAWQADLGTTPIRGGSFIYISVPYNKIEIVDSLSAPHMSCALGDNHCTLWGFSGKAAKITIIHSGKTYTFDGKINGYGYFPAYLSNANDMPINLAANDLISGTAVSQWKLVPMSATIDFVADKITGKAMSNKYFDVYAKPSTGTGYYIWTHSNNVGNFTTSFVGLINFSTSQVYYSEIALINPTTGNVQFLSGYYWP